MSGRGEVRTFEDDFAAVDLLVESPVVTKGVDAFSLAYVRVERQMRRLFTNLVFQAPAFECRHIAALRAALADHNAISFIHFEKGIEELTGEKAATWIEARDAEILRERVAEGTRYRNKIFHGQLTEAVRSTDELLMLARDLKRWCGGLGDGAARKIQYNGFSDSFRKTNYANFKA